MSPKIFGIHGNTNTSQAQSYLVFKNTK